MRPAAGQTLSTPRCSEARCFALHALSRHNLPPLGVASLSVFYTEFCRSGHTGPATLPKATRPIHGMASTGVQAQLTSKLLSQTVNPRQSRAPEVPLAPAAVLLSPRAASKPNGKDSSSWRAHHGRKGSRNLAIECHSSPAWEPEGLTPNSPMSG